MNEPPGSLLAQMSEYGSRLCPFCQAEMQQVSPAEWKCPRCSPRPTDDKQRQVQAARDALMESDDDSFDIRVDPTRLELVAEAIEALIEWHLRSGIDRGDRLRNAARRLWEARDAT